MSKNRRGAAPANPAAFSQNARPKSGKVVHDVRGNAVWDWAIETDVLNTKSTADLLSTLNGTGRFELEAGDAPEFNGDPYNRRVG